LFFSAGREPGFSSPFLVISSPATWSARPYSRPDILPPKCSLPFLLSSPYAYLRCIFLLRPFYPFGYVAFSGSGKKMSFMFLLSALELVFIPPYGTSFADYFFPNRPILKIPLFPTLPSYSPQQNLRLLICFLRLLSEPGWDLRLTPLVSRE